MKRGLSVMIRAQQEIGRLHLASMSTEVRATHFRMIGLMGLIYRHVREEIMWSA
jgi:hypothetical protein